MPYFHYEYKESHWGNILLRIMNNSLTHNNTAAIKATRRHTMQQCWVCWLYWLQASLSMPEYAPPPKKIPFLWGNADPPSNVWFFGHTRVHSPNGIWNWFNHFCMAHQRVPLTHRDRQTHWPQNISHINRPNAAMQPKNTITCMLLYGVISKTVRHDKPVYHLRLVSFPQETFHRVFHPH